MIVGMDKPSLDELAHYGVLGMKWGIRRDRTEATTLSRDERKEAKAKIKALRLHVYDKKYGSGYEISDSDYRKMSNKDLVVKKGQTIRRVTQRKNEKFSADQKAYVSYKPKDSEIYRAVMPSSFGGGGRKTYKNTYEATYKALETLKSPSEKKRIDALIQILDTKSVKTDDGKTVTGREFLENSPYHRQVKTLNSQQLGLYMYKEFAESHMWDDPLNTAYFNKLKKQGYNAIVDDNDRGHLAEAPLIILNPNGSLKKIKVKPLTADEINNAQRRLKV